METTEQSEICSKLITTPEQRQLRRSGVFILDFDWISHSVLALPLLTLKE